MCGRYTLYHDEDDLTALLEVAAFPLTPRFNVAPTQLVPWVVQRQDRSREVVTGRWGLIPTWVADPATFRTTLFNARAETAAEKPSFRDAMRRTRCVLPASGFYEWRREDGRKQPHHVVRSDGSPMLLAGLYAERPAARGGNSATVLTCAPNERLAELHDRMPVVLAPEHLPRWLDPSLDQPDDVADLLGPCPSAWLHVYPVDPRVGNTRLDDPGLVQPRPG
jgi:putative SOS response-associated peptidase YedK